MSTHYRSPLNFTLEALEAADNAINRLNDFMVMLKNVKADKESNPEVGKQIEKVEKEFEEAMDNDLNIAQALGYIFEFVKNINKLELSKNNAQKVINVIEKFDTVLGVIGKEEPAIDKEIEEKIKQREQARKAKDYATADAIRDELDKQGIILEDTPDGVRWKRK